MIDGAGVDVEDARVVRADEERCGIDSGQRGDLERCRIRAGECELKRRQRGAVVDEDAAMAGAEQDLSAGQGEQRGEVASVDRGRQKLVDDWGCARAGFEEKQPCSAGREQKLRKNAPVV
jgi:hypothetical protein